MSLDTYIRLLKDSPTVQNGRVYNLNAGEMNPEIFERFLQVFVKQPLPMVIWEPFAGTSYLGSRIISLAQDSAEREGITLISFGLRPMDMRICGADSTIRGPGQAIGGMLFHPPYYGTVPMLNDESDLSFVGEKTAYVDKLGMVIDNAIQFMVPGGLVCAVGRDYRVNGARCRLNMIFLQMFEDRGFILKEVWKSEPDVVMILCKV